VCRHKEAKRVGLGKKTQNLQGRDCAATKRMRKKGRSSRGKVPGRQSNVRNAEETKSKGNNETLGGHLKEGVRKVSLWRQCWELAGRARKGGGLGKDGGT